MRWVVELPAPSGGTAATVTVDADSWAGALTHARGGSPIKKFRCEFDADNVVRVLDLSNREWYTIRPIRSVAPEATSAPAVAAPQGGTSQPFALAVDEASVTVGAASTESPTAAETPAAPAPTASPTTAAPAPDAAAPVAETPPPAETSVAAAAPARPAETLFGVPPPRQEESRLVAVDESGEHHALPGGLAPPTLLFQRDEDPSESNPLSYRERVFVVPAGTPVGDAELVARHSVTALRRSLATRPRGRYIVVAVFDHTFTTRPERPALVEVRWKDWRGDVEVTHPAPTPPPPAAVNGTSHADASGSVDVSAVVAASSSAPEEPTPAPVAPVEVAPPAPVASVEVAPPAPVAPVEVAPAAHVDAPIVAAAPSVAEAPPVVEAPAPEAPVAPSVAAAVAVEATSVVVTAAPAVVPAPAVETPVVTPAATVVEPAAAVVEPAAVAAVAETAPAPTPSPAEPPAPVVEPAAPVVADLASASATLPPPAAPAAEVAVAATETSEATASSTVVVGDVGEPPATPAVVAEPVAAAPAVTSAPEPPAPVRRTPRTIARRTRGKDLLGELFDALMDLSHLESADAGCKHVVQILQEHLECDLAAVSLYDIDRDEFVVNASFGADGVAGRRERAKVGVASTVVKRKAGVTLASCGADDVIHDDFREGGGVFAPAMFRDRLFALVRAHRVPGAAGFETDELDALSYVAGQLGEFLSTQSKRAAAAEFAPEPRRSQHPPRR
ncbi:MAG: hypothetical protein U0325_33935 [Polyangiales bacterium]